MPLSCPYLKILFNIILSSVPRSSKWLIPIRSPHQNPVCTYPVPRACHMPGPFHSPWFDYPNNISERYRPLSCSLCSFLHSPLTSSLLGPNTLPDALFPNTLSLRSSLNVSDQVLHPYKTTDKITVVCILVFTFLGLLTKSALNLRHIWRTIRQVNDIRDKCHCP